MSGHAAGKIRRRGQIHPPLSIASGRVEHNRQIHVPWLLEKTELALAGIILGKNYQRPIVQPDVARKRTLERYAVVSAVK
jgi:hypothetical protein